MPAPDLPASPAQASWRARPVIVTRPAPDAQRWAEQLCQRGLTAEALPLLEIAAADDLTLARKAWARLSDYAALMFVSGNAVTYFFAARPANAPPLPPPLRFMAPGPGTAKVLAAHGVPAAQIDTPAGHASQFDSEALWQVVGARPWAGQRVLIVRGQSGTSPDASAPGRQWLAAQFENAGATVDFVVVYQRRVPHFSAAQLQRMEGSRHDGSVWLFSSSEALDGLPRWPGGDWSQARAIATHPRIASAVRAAGWGVVIESRPALDDIVASIESLHP
jgi:uroporphyrinogen-III synthase